MSSSSMLESQSAPMQVDNTIFSGDSVPVRFFTTTFDSKMPSTTFYMPTKVTLESLSEFVNVTLGLEDPVPFNFLVKDEFIRYSTLEKWMKKKAVDKETTLELEYTPAFEIEAGNNLPHDDWVPCIRRLPIPIDATGDVSQHPYLTVSYDKCWRLWKGEECLHVGAGHGSAIKSATIISASESQESSGKRKRDAVDCKFITGGLDGMAFVWQYSGGIAKELYKFEHAEPVEAVAVHTDKSLLCTSGWDKLIRIWTLDRLHEDLQEGVPGKQQYLHCALAGHSRAVQSVVWSEERRARIFSTGLDGTVRVWDVVKQAPIMNLRSECYSAYCMAVKGSMGGDRILTGHVDGKVRLWDTRTPTVCQSYAGHKGFVYGVTWNAFAGDGVSDKSLQFSTGAEDCSVNLWDIRSASPLASVTEHTDGILCVEWMGQGVLMTGSKDTTVKSCSVKCQAERSQNEDKTA